MQLVINYNIIIRGGKLKTDSENLTLSGANVEADKLDIKAQNVVIESKQDKSERKRQLIWRKFQYRLSKSIQFQCKY